MKVSALTKMYLWRRRCIHEGVSADEDVFMKAKMYSWRWLALTCWQRCIYEGEDVSLKVVSADENVFMKAKMYLLRWGALVSADMSALGALTYQLWFCWIYLYFIGFQILINAIKKNIFEKVIKQNIFENAILSATVKSPPFRFFMISWWGCFCYCLAERIAKNGHTSDPLTAIGRKQIWRWGSKIWSPCTALPVSNPLTANGRKQIQQYKSYIHM